MPVEKKLEISEMCPKCGHPGPANRTHHKFGDQSRESFQCTKCKKIWPVPIVVQGDFEPSYGPAIAPVLPQVKLRVS